ncbi:alpha/beta hydrolase [Pseudobutyrivibrio sp.]|uniref:alpha/beta hydrolase n=1 Tax=Pseudobutyrivibrio sp. TaxID=2014367 RepID=UPI001D33AFDD|nr:alpha/beta fold hydrolase [Pseudobutyrivibrio sp.]MBE5909920.1 alpha/beta fold hydrolase [Pseudobutyrivibrio sp.]
MEKVKRQASILLIVSIILMLISGIVVSLVQTNFGHVTVKHLYWETEAGRAISANLYIPDNATADSPAPAVVTSHGYLNNKEMQDINSVELSRRGYVVLAIDQPGCGQSDIGDYANENGSGYDFVGVYQGVLELSRLPYVDKDKIGITGHSMGGMSSNLAILEDNQNETPMISAILLNCIDAMYVEADTMGGLATAMGIGSDYVNNYMSRDVGIIACKYDEFFHQTYTEDGSVLQAPYYMTDSNFAQSFLYFGENPTGLETRNSETIYHENIDGEDAIRVIYNPAQIHPWSHFSKRSATATIEFFNECFGYPVKISSGNQIWQIKEAFNLVGLVGVVLFIVSFVTCMLFTRTFEVLRANEVAVARKANKQSIKCYIGGAVISTILAACTYQPIVEFGKNLPFTEQPMIFGIALWAAFNGVITIITLFVSSKLSSEKIDLVDCGVIISKEKIIKTVLLGIVTVICAYLCVFVADYFFVSDFRIWNVGMKVLNANTLRMALFPHALLFLVFYIAFSVANNSFNFNQIGGKKSWCNNLVLTLVALAPIIILLLMQYGSYVINKHMMWSDNNAPMNIAQLWAFLIMIPGAAVVDRMIYKVSKNPYIAGIITGIIIAIISSSNTTSRLI